MLKMTTTRMLKRAPCKSNNFKQAFARIFDTTAIRLFENIFWWVWSIEFQEGPSEEQLCVIRADLRRVISQQYVCMVCRLDDHHGRVSEVLPKGHVRADALLKGNVVISSRRAKDLFFQVCRGANTSSLLSLSPPLSFSAYSPVHNASLLSSPLLSPPRLFSSSTFRMHSQMRFAGRSTSTSPSCRLLTDSTRRSNGVSTPTCISC